METPISIRRAYSEWMNEFPWEVSADLTFKYETVREDFARSMLKIWCRKIAKEEGVRLACEGILNLCPGNHPHIHLLMLARSGKTGKRLLDSNLDRLANWWPARALVEPIRNKKALSIYIFIKNTKGRHLEVYYGNNLLKELIKGKDKRFLTGPSSSAAATLDGKVDPLAWVPDMDAMGVRFI